MWRRGFLALAGPSLVCGCAGAVHQLPGIDSANLSLAQTEVQKAGGPPGRRAVSDDEAKEIMESALKRIRPSADRLCQEMNTGVCQWRFGFSSNGSLNASSGPNGQISINRGIIEYAANEEEVAMVIAHEIAHQASNHMATAQRNQAVGAVIGAILLGVLVGVATSRSSHGASSTRAATQTGGDIGGAVGRISYSKEQEREADYLAAVILYRAEVDLDKARGFLVTMARASGRKESGMLDTHPAGPERLAAWDKAVQEIRASKGSLPKRA